MAIPLFVCLTDFNMINCMQSVYLLQQLVDEVTVHADVPAWPMHRAPSAGGGGA